MLIRSEGLEEFSFFDNNSCFFMHKSYLDNLKVLSILYDKLLRLKEEEQNNLKQERNTFNDKNELIKTQRQIYDEIRKLLDEKQHLYTLELSSENRLRLNKINEQLNRLVQKQATNDFKIMQYHMYLRKLPLAIEANKSSQEETKQKIKELETHLLDLYNTINWAQIYNQKCALTLSDFSHIENPQLRNLVLKSVSMTFELEKLLVQSISKYSAQVLKNGNYKNFPKHIEMIYLILDIINRIYRLIQDISSYNDINNYESLEILVSIIPKVSGVLKNSICDKKSPTNLSDLIKLKDVVELNKVKVLKRNRPAILFKKKLETSLDIYTRISDIITILEGNFKQTKEDKVYTLI